MCVEESGKFTLGKAKLSMIRIAFGFQARVGKDTAADFLAFKYGGTKLAFADPLKEIRDFAQETVGCPTTEDHTLLQYLGGWAKGHNPDILVNALARSIPQGQNAYVSDVRFKGEFEFLKSQGFLLVRVKRKGAATLTANESAHTHESEHGLHDAPWDCTLKNYGNREDLYDQLCRLVKRYFPHASVVETFGRCVCCLNNQDEDRGSE